MTNSNPQNEAEMAQEPDDGNINKKLKTENNETQENVVKETYKKPDRCNLCKQFSDSVHLYSGHPNNSNEEFIALTDPKISLFTGNEEVYNEEDVPTHQITYFTVYDKNGHLCYFDSGLVEKNVPLYFSGYIKPVYDENPNTDNAIPAHDLGPIDEWWMAGLDGGENIRVGFTTQYAQYYLMEPSAQYQPIFNKIKEKVKLSKYVIEFISDHHWENPKYEDLVENIEGSGEYINIEDTLMQHAQFICDQVVSYDQNAEDDEQPLITLPCMRTLVAMAGVAFKHVKKLKSVNKIVREKKNNMTKAVTTKLVHDVFEYFFPEQIDAKGLEKGPKKKRCGICESCQSPDCGECNHCRDMVKFGGSGKSKQACKRRRCMHMAIIDAEVSDNEDEKEDTHQVKSNKTKQLSTKIIHNVKWKDESKEKYKDKTCYSSAIVDDFIVQIGDYVMVKSKNPKEPSYIARIIRMFDQLPQKYLFHGLLLCRGSDTILGETSDPRELFIIDDCENLLLGSIICKVEVTFRQIPDNWSSLGGEQNLEEQLEDDGKTFYFTKRFHKNRFEDLDFDPNANIDGCEGCKRQTMFKKQQTPTLVNNCIKWKNENYKTGTGVFLDPDVYTFNNYSKVAKENNENQLDTVLYPEYFRKSDSVKGSNENTVSPFVIGIIEDIKEPKNKNIKIEVRIFFRPEHTFVSMLSVYTKDLNYLFYSDEVITVPFDKVMGKCYLSYGYNFESPTEWSELGPYRFYFTEAYDPENKKITELPTNAKNIGIKGKGKGGGKIKGKAKLENDLADLPPVWDKVDRPLRCMDVFAGCGGLSEGLKMSNIADSRWAIEKEVPAANAFRMNNPNCKVFNDDCNNLLKLIVNNEAKEKGLPEKGEVEMIVGGPPCQGFSGMNRFNSRNYSSFKNSLVVSLLSLCEYYRPEYFILENVRNFVSFKKSMVLKLTLRCLLTMGYQVTFGILQAGQYGVPQTRRRLILIAAAPGNVLPKYPEPLHVFSKKGTHLTFNVDGYSYYNECDWVESAPYRTITVRDALCDLPEIKNGCSKLELPYDSEPKTHYQRIIRSNEDTILVRDHICKEMSALVEARMSHIPTYPGADWRDLPNISLTLPDGTKTFILQYPYKTGKKKGSKGGVCQCALGNPCDPADKQSNTLIPWCLPHTADRHNHWAGLYGRLEWDGYFGTTITNPEPMGKQGRVLHPEQHRVVSVRECARSQGFPDKFRFCGNILDKYRQVGNAVPPLLGLAIGKEFVKAYRKTMDNKMLGTLNVANEEIESKILVPLNVANGEVESKIVVPLNVANGEVGSSSIEAGLP
ncbi:DNA (cytosine-5)-methyltransferase PliMCI [Diabrotica virgifera virgifera]|uniref:DNA (cytosine-5-)-methyltransferase n=1 Tax=Diabrotica virgifera virgifera TaxID=50390 RepID=A0ABM5KQA6_DIAVI|nr:DNA (cytosine-5)-methyltransferase PliMCI [Diabrotica virgifera virgifera]